MTTATPERGHVLTITRSADWDHEDPAYDFAITCVEPKLCNGYWECSGDHSGFDPNDETSPAYDEEEFQIHGEWHTYRYSIGWTVAYPGCVVATCDSLGDSAHWIADEHGPGHFIVDDEWGDPGDVWLHMVERLPDYARAERVLRILGAAA